MKDFIKYVLATAVGVVFGAVICVFLLVFMFVGVAMLGTKLTASSSATKVKEKSTLVLSLADPIKETGNELNMLLGGYHMPTLRQLSSAIEYAAEDKKIEGIYLKLSVLPQGWSTVKTVRESLEKFKTSGKFIYAYAEHYDEKSYYLATIADKIFMHPKGEFIWDGFAAVPAFYKNTFDKLGIKPIIFRVGKYKSAIEPLTQTKMSEANKAQTSELIDDIWQEVISVVSGARKLDPTDIEKMAELLEVRSADEAFEKGMVDELKIHSEIFEKDILKKTADKVSEDDVDKLVEIGEYIMTNKSVLAPSMTSLFGGEVVIPAESIAIINVEGVIMSGRNTEDGVGADDIVSLIQQAKYNNDVKGVVLRVNSPGGSALASDVIWTEIKKLRDIKPVYASFGDVAASGGYYVGVAAEKIFAHPNTITGSIGVYSVLMDIQKGAESKLGLSFDRVVTHPYADRGSAVRTITPQESQFFQEDTNRVYQRFIEVVQAGRQFDTYEDTHAIAQGRVWSGTQAKQIGLVDEIGNLNDTVASLAAELKLSESYKVIELRPRLDLGLLFGSLLLEPYMKLFPLSWLNEANNLVLRPLKKADFVEAGERVWSLTPSLQIR